MPVAVGGVDFPGKSSWRRFTDDDPLQVTGTEAGRDKTTGAFGVGRFVCFLERHVSTHLWAFQAESVLFTGCVQLVFFSERNKLGH